MERDRCGLVLDEAVGVEPWYDVEAAEVLESPETCGEARLSRLPNGMMNRQL